MNDTVVTLVGNAATGVEYRETPTGGVARFRFAVTPRRWDRRNSAWADGSTSFYTVCAWRNLGANLTASVNVGDPLVVHGRLRVREEAKDGQRRTFVDIDAVSIGHDLTWGTSAFKRVARADPTLTERPAATSAAATAANAATGAGASAGAGERVGAGAGASGGAGRGPAGGGAADEPRPAQPWLPVPDDSPTPAGPVGWPAGPS
ncbi:single-stranded DNA-binding protein [Streptomyces sp. NBC_01498]|uniref:single-stranded DNA-binding protein n=1 Tax=Streptomyces sp. NBC_01498 TaxID=2975870 RepID=UPI002E7AEC52|nr:single-stranded DNA-binding protein [Streptomyces sp. NBC_01498]WTL26856.1 single-stranded DNA-binding protein [Streptomyces sp. NBC_01498]